jgi:hypothetical protein
MEAISQQFWQENGFEWFVGANANATAEAESTDGNTPTNDTSSTNLPEPAAITPCTVDWFRDDLQITAPNGRSFSGADLNMAGRLVFAESGTNVQEREAVASVVYNRLSDKLPTFTAVATSGAFQAVTGSEEIHTRKFRSSGPGEYRSLQRGNCISLNDALSAVNNVVQFGPVYPQFNAFRGGTTPKREGMTVIGNTRFAASDSVFNPPTKKRGKN